MVKKLKALDLFCGAGGATRGLLEAGFDVLGVDIEPQPRHPRPAKFMQADALRILRSDLPSTFDFIWASPPCQAHTVLKHAPNAKTHKTLIPAVRRLLRKIGKPYVIENVEGAPLENPVTLCGSMFGLTVSRPSFGIFELRRHRLFECSFPVEAPNCQHYHPVAGVYGGHVRVRAASAGGRGTVDLPGEDRPTIAAELFGVRPGEMTMNELSQAIPPAYSRYIAEQFLLTLPRR